MDKFKYIICLSFLMIFLSSFDDYNESGKVFFNYGVSETNYKSYYTNAYMSTESVYPNGIYLYFYFIDNAAKKAGVMQINLATAYDTVMYLPCSDAKVYYFEKTKGTVTYKSEDVTGSIVLDTEAVGSEITSLSIKFNLNINTNGVTDYIFYKGYASSTSVDKEYRDDNTNNNNNSTTTTTSAGCGEDPYEDTDDDSSCSGNPSNSGVEDDNSTSSCSDEPHDETDDTTSCDSGSDSESDYGDDEDASCDSGDTSGDSSDSTDASCSNDDDADTGDDSSGDCSGDEVEASNTFTHKKQKKNMKKMINFFMPVFFISVFVFTLKKRKKYL